MTRYNARTTNPSKFLGPKFNINPDCQNKFSKQIVKTIYWLNTRIYFMLGQKYKNIFVRFLVQMKTVEFVFEINWHLAGLNS